MEDLESAAETLRRYGLEEVSRLQAEVERLQRNITFLLRHAGEHRPCLGCKAEIYMVEHKSRARCPYNPDGSPHWANCPDAPRFRGKSERRP
jgi:hypothetical protein